jgi:hypothetical protein
MALGCMKLVEEFAEKMRNEVRPFYIVFFAKPDANCNGIRQTVKAYYRRPAALLGILVWYVNNPQGIFDFVPELSSPPDVPIHPADISDRSEDASTRIMEKGKQLNVLVS